MRKLERPKAPKVLSEFDFNLHTWDDFKPKHKRIVWESLFEMQGEKCAYCENSIDPNKDGDKHIEHFLRKGLHKELTFNWDNLFGSCCIGECCGKYKDKQKYSEDDLIKMDIEDPEKYFIFTSSGSIIVRDNLSENDKKRASETLRVFHLNPRRGGLRAQRANIISSHKYMADAMISFMVDIKKDIQDGNEKEELLLLALDEYMENVKKLPFSTALKHYLHDVWSTNY